MVEQTKLFSHLLDYESAEKKLKPSSVIIEKMTSNEINDSLFIIQYYFGETRFGEILIAFTIKGICFLAFVDSKETAIQDLKNYYPQAKVEQTNSIKHNVVFQFINGESLSVPIILHIKGTEFQFQVWQKLLEIPKGKLISYSHLAKSISKPNAARAAGTAIGSNPIAYIIPCHRVVQSNGNLGGYMWGLEKKEFILSQELVGRTN